MRYKKAGVVFAAGMAAWLAVSVILASPSVRDADSYRRMSRILSRFEHDPEARPRHELYRWAHPPTPLVRGRRAVFPPDRLVSPPDPAGAVGTPVLLVIAEAGLYADPEAGPRIDRYARDLRSAFVTTVFLEVGSGGSAADMKNLIRDYWLRGVNGVVLMGRLPAAWFETENDHSWADGGLGYADWTCDLFFMDLDGEWRDGDGNGMYDQHSPGAGDLGPEIFIGRIDASTMGAYGDEIGLFCLYMDKNHEYWTGRTELPQYALGYHDYGWIQWPAHYLGSLFGDTAYEYRGWEETGGQVSRYDYAHNRLPDRTYGFIQIWAHATHAYHDFHSGGRLFCDEIASVFPGALGVNIDGCHGCDWAGGLDRKFLGGTYVFAPGSDSLVVVGTTKVGGMLGFPPFYRSLGQNFCLGRAFREWFDDRLRSPVPYDELLGWHYGMIIVGDPLICFREVPGAGRPWPPPSGFEVSRVENRALFRAERIDVMVWNLPSDGHGADGLYVRIREYDRGHPRHVADVPISQGGYWRRGVENREIRYGICVTDGIATSQTVYFTVAPLEE